VAVGQVFDRLQECLVPLPHDLVEPSRPDPVLLKLSKRSAGFNRFMLPDVSDEDYAVIGTQAAEELVDLLGAGKRGLIQKVGGRSLIALLWLGEMHLEGRAFGSALGELLGRAGGWRETPDYISFLFEFLANYG
jgi:hypothetical protein